MDNMALQEDTELHFPTPKELSHLIATVVHNYLQQHEPALNPSPACPAPPPYVVETDEQSRES